MANVLTRIETVDNTGTTLATFGQNVGKHVINQADVGRELIISLTRTNANGGLTDAVITSVRNAITQAGGVAGVLPASTGDAFTVAAIGTADGSAILNTAAAISGSTATTTIFMRVQGTGTFNTTDATAGVSNLTVAVVATFAPAL
jgi:hypothetical protein